MKEEDKDDALILGGSLQFIYCYILLAIALKKPKSC